MMEFITALGANSFLQYALLAGVLASISCGVIGTYVVTKKISLVSGGISHTVLGGVGLAYFLNTVHGTHIPPLYGALVFAILSALIIGFVKRYSEHDSDTIIAAMWSTGMAIGVIFIALTPGYNTDLMSYLFGNILMVTKHDLYLMMTLDITVIIVGVALYNKLCAICFDEDFAKIKGVNVTFYYLLLLCLTAVTIVTLIQVVGIILVIALLTIPAAIAKQYSNSMWKMMLGAVVLGVLFTVLGLAVSYSPDLPSGAVIIIIASLSLAASTIYKSLRSNT
ncbi:MAG: metal ABC transporter permease [Pseudomonadota bacterium]